MKIDNITIEHDEDIIFTTVAKYKLFLSYGKIGLDSYVLYSHLMFTARLQETNQVKANNVYLRYGLKWGKDKLQKAKNLLTELELIETFPRINEETKQIQGWYIKVKTRKSPFEIKQIDKKCTKASDPESQTVAPPEGGFQDTNALTKNINALTKKVNTIKPILEAWNGVKIIIHREAVVHRKFSKKHYDIIKDYGIENIIKAVINYKKVLKNSNQFYSHKFSLWRFIEKVDEFVDESEPWNNWIIDNKETTNTAEEFFRKREQA